jgi:hypothetical protein
VKYQVTPFGLSTAAGADGEQMGHIIGDPLRALKLIRPVASPRVSPGFTETASILKTGFSGAPLLKGEAGSLQSREPSKNMPGAPKTVWPAAFRAIPGHQSAMANSHPGTE